MADLFDTGVFSDMAGASVLAGTTLRTNVSMYVLFLHNKLVLFSLLVLLEAHWRLLSE
jgi:hypothetical protein